MCAFVFLATIFHALQLLRQIRPKLGSAVFRIPGISIFVALLRSISYVNLKTPKAIRIPAMHHCLFISVFFIALVAWVFGIKPYYRRIMHDGSPPLAIRSGLVSIAFFPFIFSCALKVNPISMLTGISHARLQVYHQSLAFMMFFFALVHTIPFLYQFSHDGGYAALHEQYASDPFFWTGTVALGLVGWMLCSSLGVFRNMSYRFFVIQHVVSVMLLLGFTFAHLQNLLTSHLFVWAAVALWIFSIVVRGSMVLISSDFFAGERARVDIQAVTNLPLENEKKGERAAETIRLTLTTPLRWRPGQHIYVRFPGFSVAQAHPFTIMSLPNKSRLDSQLVLLAKVHEGTTRKIFNYVKGLETHCPESSFTNEINTSLNTRPSGGFETEKSKVILSTSDSSSVSSRLESSPAMQQSQIRSAQIAAYLDGPYGFTTDPASFEQVILFAGGTGISHIYPILYRLLQRCEEGDPLVLTKRVHFIWSTHSSGLINWLESELEAILALQRRLSIQLDMDLHVTGELSEPEHKTFAQTLISCYGVRPDIRCSFREELAQATELGFSSLASYVCGPLEMTHAVSNCAARANWDLARGRLSPLRDIYLEVEHFSW